MFINVAASPSTAPPPVTSTSGMMSMWPSAMAPATATSAVGTSPVAARCASQPGPVSAEAPLDPVGRIEAAANAQLTTGAEGAPVYRRTKPGARVPDTLRSTPVRGYPDAFYDSIATAYGNLVATGSKPVYELATASDVPVTPPSAG